MAIRAKEAKTRAIHLGVANVANIDWGQLAALSRIPNDRVFRCAVTSVLEWPKTTLKFVESHLPALLDATRTSESDGVAAAAEFADKLRLEYGKKTGPAPRHLAFQLKGVLGRMEHLCCGVNGEAFNRATYAQLTATERLELAKRWPAIYKAAGKLLRFETANE
jgi:hypothetical protein